MESAGRNTVTVVVAIDIGRGSQLCVGITTQYTIQSNNFCLTVQTRTICLEYCQGQGVRTANLLKTELFKLFVCKLKTYIPCYQDE